MQSQNVQAFTVEQLHGQLIGPELRLRGSIRTVSAQSQLERNFVQVHQHVTNLKYPTFTVDVRALTFVNSSAIRLFVNWIALAERAGYKLVFLTERNVTWHRLSFSVLKDLAPASVEIRDQHAAGGVVL